MAPSVGDVAAGPTLKRRSASPKPHAAAAPATGSVETASSAASKVAPTPHIRKQKGIPPPEGLRRDVLALYGAAAFCMLLFAILGEGLKNNIPPGKYQKLDKTFISIMEFDVLELGPFPKCHPHYGEHESIDGLGQQWVKQLWHECDEYASVQAVNFDMLWLFILRNSEVPHGGPYPPGHPENPDWLAAGATKQTSGNAMGMFQAHAHLILLPALCVLLASKQGLWLFSAETSSGSSVPPILEQEDAYWFPILGSGALFSLFVVLKYLGHDWLKHAITAIMVSCCAFGVASNIDAAVHIARGKRSPLIRCPIASLQLEISVTDVLGFVAASTLAVVYVLTKNWIVNNVLGFSFCLLGTRSVNLSSYSTGVVLLSGLFLYDVFWVFFSKPVFGANVMVSVAKGIEAPIKLLLPRDYGGCGDLQFNMLGLGDIAIPGLFLAFLSKWDAVKMADGSSRSFVYLNCAIVAYILSLATTVTAMMVFQHPQPALLYICPYVLMASLGVALARGELADLVAFTLPDVDAGSAHKEDNDKKRERTD